MVNSRQKGKRGELELAAKLRELFPHLDVRRSQQFSGKTDDSMDLVGFPGLSIECKRVQSLNIYNAIQQALEGKGVPSVFHRKNHQDWLVTVRLSDLIEFARIIMEQSNGEELPQLGNPVTEQRPEER